MSFSVVLLIVLGVVAAGAAALFTATLSAGNIGEVLSTATPDVVILVAKEDIGKTMSIRESDIVSKTVAASATPVNYYTDPTQIIGRRVVSDMFSGQAFTKASFPTAGSGVQLATQIPQGKRAVSIQISSYESLQGLLYPGAIVDVLASFRVSGYRDGNALSTTLLQNIQVLAVSNIIVGDNSTLEQEDDRLKNRVSNQPSVTLLVTTKQAEALQLAMKFGQISLTMRNPSDAKTVDDEATLLSEGIMAELATLLGTTVSDETTGEEEIARVVRDEPVEVTEVVPTVKVAAMMRVNVIRALQLDPNGPKIFPLED
ncbi:MAG: Flp pilus assembly protein CpaB [Candidatus Hydrogenedentota bacterium]